MRIFKNLDPRENRLPADTSRSIQSKPIRHVALANPDLMVTNHPGIQRNLAQYDQITPKAVRQEFGRTLDRMVASANRQIAKSAKFRGIQFEVDERSGRSVITVRDTRSGQVLKQIPSEQMVEMAGRLKDASGLLTDISI